MWVHKWVQCLKRSEKGVGIPWSWHYMHCEPYKWVLATKSESTQEEYKLDLWALSPTLLTLIQNTECIIFSVAISRYLFVWVSTHKRVLLSFKIKLSFHVGWLTWKAQEDGERETKQLSLESYFCFHTWQLRRGGCVEGSEELRVINDWGWGTLLIKKIQVYYMAKFINGFSINSVSIWTISVHKSLWL